MPTVTSLGIWLYPQSPCPQLEKWGGGGGGGGATHISNFSQLLGGGGGGYLSKYSDVPTIYKLNDLHI